MFENCIEVRLREFRARYRVSQEELAKSVGVTRQTIIAIEKGKYLPSLTLALKIAQRYYNEKKYSKALLWTKKANILDRRAEGAWILYAKSEYKKGNQDRAIEILRLYLANASSKDGESLLIAWTQGRNR